jgi:hypothetical protein
MFDDIHVCMNHLHIRLFLRLVRFIKSMSEIETENRVVDYILSCGTTNMEENG